MFLQRFIILAALAACGSSLQAVPIVYLPTDWSLSGPASTSSLGVNTGSGIVTFQYSLPGEVTWDAQTWTILTTAKTTDKITLHWDYTGFHAFYDVYAFLNLLVDGKTTPLVDVWAEKCCSTPSGGFDYTGTITVPVSMGQQYGFSMGGSNYDLAPVLSGTFLLSAADSTPTPEPAHAWMIPVGLAAIAIFGKFRKHRLARRRLTWSSARMWGRLAAGAPVVYRRCPVQARQLAD